MQKLFENWRRFINEEAPKIQKYPGGVAFERDEEGTLHCGKYKEPKSGADVPSLTQAQRDAWLASQRPRGAGGPWIEELKDMCHQSTKDRPSLYTNSDSCIAYECAMEKGDHCTKEDIQAFQDPEGYEVHIAAKDVCGDDQQCYIEYVMANDPELQDNFYDEEGDPKY